MISGSATQLRQQAQHLEVQPHDRHEQTEPGVPLHERRRPPPNPVLDEVEVEEEVERGDPDDEEREADADQPVVVDVGNVGTEQVFVFLSREPLKTLPGFDRPVKTIERGNGVMIAELQNSIASRDLVFAKDRAPVKGQRATYVVNKAEVGKAVTASFALIHK